MKRFRVLDVRSVLWGGVFLPAMRWAGARGPLAMALPPPPPPDDC